MPADQPSLKSRLAHALFGDIIQTAVAEATATIPVRVDDTPGWNRLAPASPHDHDFAECYRIRKTPSKPGQDFPRPPQKWLL